MFNRKTKDEFLVNKECNCNKIYCVLALYFASLGITK